MRWEQFQCVYIPNHEILTCGLNFVASFITDFACLTLADFPLLLKPVSFACELSGSAMITSDYR